MENRYIKVQYKLYAPMGKEKNIELVEETRPEMPFMFISGLGMVLKELENQLQDIKEGESFDITLTEEQAYGPFYEEGVQEVPVEAFFINGKMVEELNILERWMDKEGKTRIRNVRTLVFPLEKAGNFQSKITNLKVEQK